MSPQTVGGGTWGGGRYHKGNAGIPLLLNKVHLEVSLVYTKSGEGENKSGESY